MLAEIFFVTGKEDLVAGSLVDEDSCDGAKDRHERSQPLCESDHAHRESCAVPGICKDRPNGPEGRRHRLADAVDCAQHRWTRRAVV